MIATRDIIRVGEVRTPDSTLNCVSLATRLLDKKYIFDFSKKTIWYIFSKLLFFNYKLQYYYAHNSQIIILHYVFATIVNTPTNA
jgi:hypothetical protein